MKSLPPNPWPWREGSVVVILLLSLGWLGLAAPSFFKPAALWPWLTSVAPVLLIATGMFFVIVGRQIDISVGSQFAWCSVLAGEAASAGWPWPGILASALLAGLALGALNGLLVAGFKLPSIVVTLATMVTLRESLRAWREGEFVRDLPDSFQWFGLGQSLGQCWVIAAALLLWMILWIASVRLSVFRWVYAVGSNAEAARLAGLRPARITFGLFAFMGLLTGLAATLNAVRFTDVDPKTGAGLELQAIAAVVVGGVSISGGRGRLWGVLAGVLLLACLPSALVFLKWPPHWEKAIQGLIILTAVAAEGVHRARSRGRED
ncbi:MAG: ABC transporter permease [Verrucomicrobia bacterium]|nr:ABC transporter permease [Verrucomicrobiota bacterium]